MTQTIPLVDLISGNGPQYDYYYEVVRDDEQIESVVYENASNFKLHLLSEVMPGLIFGSNDWQLMILRRSRDIDREDNDGWTEWIQINGRNI